MPTHFPSGVVSYGVPVIGGDSAHPMFPDRPADVFFCDEVNGSNSNSGKRPDDAYSTIQNAIDQATDGRNTLIFLVPGNYEEAVNVNKRNIAIIGASGRFPGLTRISHDGSTARCTIHVGDGFLRGFYLANVSVDTDGGRSAGGVNRHCIHLVTNDTETYVSTANDYNFVIENCYIDGDNAPLAGILLDGATFGRISNTTIRNCDYGVGFMGNSNNTPSLIDVLGCAFQDNEIADLATFAANTSESAVALAGLGLANIKIHYCSFNDVGGTPVTNYINFTGSNNVNVTVFGCYFARDIASGTLVQGGTNLVVAGSYSPSGLESFTV